MDKQGKSVRDRQVSVSIIIPTYNVEKYVRQCLSSVLGQSIRDIEVICVDDGSSDRSADICEEMARTDSRVRVVRREHTNAGAVRNAGLALARGEYVGFVDSDDWCEREMFELLYARAKENDADVVSLAYRPYDMRTGTYGSPRCFSDRIVGLGDVFSASQLGQDVFNPLVWGPWGRIVRREFLQSNGIVFQEVPYADDVYICCMIHALASRQVIVNNPLYCYRIGSGASQQQRNYEHTGNIILAWEKVAQEICARNIQEGFRGALAASSANSMFHSLNTVCEAAAYCSFYRSLRRTYQEHPFFGTVTTEEVPNRNSRTFLAMLREIEDPLEFLVRQKSFYDENLSKTWWELVAARTALRRGTAGARMSSARVNVSNGIWQTNRWKALRGVVKQVLPFGYMRRHLKKVYGLDHPVRGTGRIGQFICNLLPFYFLQDRELMLHHAGRDIPVDTPTAVRSQMTVLRSKAKVSSSVGPREMIKEVLAGAHYDRVPNILFEVLACDEVHGDEPGVRRMLSAWLHRLDLKNVIELLGAPTASSEYQQLASIYNEPPAVLSDAWPRVKRVRERCAAPRLSFVVPVYNAAPYLVRCLESLRRQTVEDIEIVCIDDGSSDGSLALLESIAASDARVIVVHQENSGVSAARNLGLSMARGVYVSFVDGDDWIEPHLAARTLEAAEKNDLDVCFFDFECVDHKTRKAAANYWSLSRHREDWIFDEVFSPVDLVKWCAYGSVCTQIYRRLFLDRLGLRFGKLKLSEDALFLYALMPEIKRAMCLDEVLYHYRKGNPASAVARLSGRNANADAVRAKLDSLAAFERLFEDRFLSRQFVCTCAAFAERVFADITHHKKASSAVAAWIDQGNCEKLVQYASWWKNIPLDAARAMKDLEAVRLETEQDLYLVAGQLAASNIDPIDSWTFFKWLQQKGIPSRYLVWEKSEFYAKLVASGDLHDVIATKTNCRGAEIVTFSDLWVRAKAFVVEWQLDGFPDFWLHELPRMQYVFLQHGVTGCWITEAHRKTFKNSFNACNVFSQREMDLIVNGETGPGESRFFIAGLPRFDLLSCDYELKSDKASYTVFVMFTWRNGLNVGGTRLANSAYWKGLLALLSKETRERLSRLGVRFVVAPHHRLLQFVPDLDFGEGVKVIGQEEVAHWIRKADAMVTDFSSASFDFMYQGKPTVYWIPDRDDLLLDHANMQDGGKVDAAVSLRKNFYNTVDTVEEVVLLLEDYARRGFLLEDDKKRIADSYFDVRSNISEKVYREIERLWAESEA